MDNLQPSESNDPIIPDDIVPLQNSEASTKQLKKISYKSLKRLASLIRTWIFTIVIALLLIILVRLVIIEINDKSYRIQSFRFPEGFNEKGYNSTTIAYRLLDKINGIIKQGNYSRSVKDIQEYIQTAEQAEIKVEISGIGVSPEVIAIFIKKALGIKSNTIGGDIVIDNKTMKLFLRIADSPTRVLNQEIDSAGISVALEKIILKAAEEVVMKDNPLLMGFYYNSEQDEKAVDAFRQAILRNPKQAATIYAYWAEYLSDSKRDTAQAMIKVRKALSIEPNNPVAQNMLGYIGDNFTLEERERYLRKSIAIDSTLIATWFDLGAALSLSPERENEAIKYLEKSYAMDNTYTQPLGILTELYLLQGKLDEASDYVDRMLFIDPEFLRADLFNIAVSIARQDTADAWRSYRKVKGRVSNRRIMSLLNTLAYKIELRKNYETSFRLVKFALIMDSTSASARFPYSTLAELHGLTGNKKGFYTNIKKAVNLGYDLTDPEVASTEPYKTFSSEQEYKDILQKIRSKKKPLQ
jgi:tetratricopeptide (TPR) repeat protein